MKELKHLTLLHSNDLHGDFLAEKIDDRLVGGVARLSGYVGKVRQEEPNTLYCIAGDMFRGSVIDSEYQGVSTIEIMNMLAPDVVTVGNHEVDYGVAHLLFIEKCANFPIINANLYIKTNHARLFNPCLIREINGMKVLFIGILTEEVLSQTRSDGIIGTIVDIEEAAAEVSRICNTYGSVDIDLTVLLTHIGFEADKELAARLDPALGVDLIIGGHSHTLPEEPSRVNDILIVQAGVGTDQIGRFDLTVDTETNSVASYEWQAIPINDETCPRDGKVEKLIRHYKRETDRKYRRVITRLTRKATHPGRYCESEMGNLIADALRDALGMDVMFVASGSIRTKELGPIVLYSDLMETFPFDDPAMMATVTGAQLKRIFRHLFRPEAWAEGSHTEFYQVSRDVRVRYDRSSQTLLECCFRGMPVADDQLITIGAQGFHFSNFEAFFGVPLEEITANGAPRKLATSCREILEEYFTAHQLLRMQVEGRLEIL